MKINTVENKRRYEIMTINDSGQVSIFVNDLDKARAFVNASIHSHKDSSEDHSWCILDTEKVRFAEQRTRGTAVHSKIGELFFHKVEGPLQGNKKSFMDDNEKFSNYIAIIALMVSLFTFMGFIAFLLYH